MGFLFPLLVRVSYLVRKHGASLWLQRRPRGLLALTDRLLTAYAHPANPPNVQEKERPEADPRIGIH
eukprot:COSAG06_NODE_795_length_12228_cov_51.650507_1_plen_66_part_10